MPWIYKLVGVVLIGAAFVLAPEPSTYANHGGLAGGLAIAGGLCLLGAAILETATETRSARSRS